MIIKVSLTLVHPNLNLLEANPILFRAASIETGMIALLEHGKRVSQNGQYHRIHPDLCSQVN